MRVQVFFKVMFDFSKVKYPRCIEKLIYSEINFWSDKSKTVIQICMLVTAFNEIYNIKITPRQTLNYHSNRSYLEYYEK